MPPSPLPTTGRWKTFVRHVPVDLHVPDRRAPGKLVRAEEGRVAHPRGRADEVADEVGERRRRHPLRDQGEHDVAAVAVGEALAGRELLRVPVEDFEICLGRGELLRRNGQQVLREVQIELLVEVVADPRPVREQVLDRDALVDRAEGRRREPNAPSSRGSRAPSSTRRMTTSAVSPFVPLAMPNCVSASFGMACARSASPYARTTSMPPGTVDADDSREAGLGGDRPEVARECAHLALGPRDVAAFAGIDLQPVAHVHEERHVARRRPSRASPASSRSRRCRPSRRARSRRRSAPPTPASARPTASR